MHAARPVTPKRLRVSLFLQVRYTKGMAYGITLLLHIALAMFTGALVLYILSAISLKHQSSYSLLAQLLAAVMGMQIVSGTVLAILSPTLTAAALSFHVIVYLSICSAVECLLLVKMGKEHQLFPAFRVAAPACLSVFMFGLVVVLGF